MNHRGGDHEQYPETAAAGEMCEPTSEKCRTAGHDQYGRPPGWPQTQNRFTYIMGLPPRAIEKK